MLTTIKQLAKPFLSRVSATLYYADPSVQEALEKRIHDLDMRLLRERLKNEDLEEQNQSLRHRLEDGDLGEGCDLHGHAPHGQEAEELRKGIDELVQLESSLENNTVKLSKLEELLDRVSARDSNAHMRANEEMDELREQLALAKTRELRVMDTMGGKLIELRALVATTAEKVAKELRDTTWLAIPGGYEVAESCGERMVERFQSEVLDADVQAKPGKSYALDCTRIAATSAIKSGVRAVSVEPNELLALVDTAVAAERFCQAPGGEDTEELGALAASLGRLFSVRVESEGSEVSL